MQSPVYYVMDTMGAVTVVVPGVSWMKMKLRKELKKQVLDRCTEEGKKVSAYNNPDHIQFIWKY